MTTKAFFRSIRVLGEGVPINSISFTAADSVPAAFPFFGVAPREVRRNIKGVPSSRSDVLARLALTVRQVDGPVPIATYALALPFRAVNDVRCPFGGQGRGYGPDVKLLAPEIKGNGNGVYMTGREKGT